MYYSGDDIFGHNDKTAQWALFGYILFNDHPVTHVFKPIHHSKCISVHLQGYIYWMIYSDDFKRWNTFTNVKTNLMAVMKTFFQNESCCTCSGRTLLG